MEGQNRVNGWLKAAIVIAFIGFFLSLSSMGGLQAARAQAQGSPASAAGFSWEYQLDFTASTLKDAQQQASGLTPGFNNLGVSSELQELGGANYSLAMTGSQGIGQVRKVLYSPLLADFIGGPAEIDIDMPLSGLQAMTFKLESNLTTGYSWEVVSSDNTGFSQVGESTFKARSNSYGAPSVQTLVVQPDKVGEGTLKLVYRRPFGAEEAITRHLHITLTAQTAGLDLSNPDPKVIDLNSLSNNLTVTSNPIANIPLNGTLPSSLDWRTSGIVPAIRNQGQCGSCWAFGTVGAMESAVAKAGGPLLDLSEQFLVSCNKDGWNCESGGLTAHKYHYDTLALNQTAIGAVLEADDPYTATDGTCGVYNHPYQLSGWQFVGTDDWSKPTVDQIKNAIYTYGPVTAAICAGNAFQAYTGGVFTTDESSSCPGGTDHMIVLVGWNDSPGYWILRNSWGTGWGENGYMRIAYNTSNVGTGASWVIWGGQGTLSGVVSDGSTSTPIVGATVSVNGHGQTTSGAGGVYSINLPPGTYSITTSAYGYLSNTINNVSVSKGATTTKNIALMPAPTHVVSGKVTDSTTGWPLYAGIGISGYPGGTVWTDPVTGNYTITLPEGSTYVFSVNAWVQGYTSASRSFGPLMGNLTENFALSVDATACNAPGYKSTGFTEKFDSVTPPTLPSPWAQAEVSGTDGGWATNAGTVHPSGIAAHSAPNLVYFNSWTANSGEETRLYRSAGLNMTTLSNSTLTFWMYHDTDYNSSANDYVQVQVSTNGGGTWNNVGSDISRYDGSTGWKQHNVDLSAYASQTDLRLGFLGVSGWGNDIHIDDISIGTPSCTAQAGGLVVGKVFDASTSTPLVGATVANDSGYTTTTVAATDPAVGDGFYTLFSPTGTHTFTASKNGYGSDTADLAIVQSTTMQKDFNLTSTSLSYAPSTLQATLQLGTSLTVPFKLTDQGGLPATFDIRESNGGFTPMLASGLGQGTWLYQAKTGVPMKSNKGDSVLAYPKAYRWTPDKSSSINVLFYADDWLHTSPNTYLDQALHALGYAYTAHYDGDFSGFESDLASGTWDMVLYEGNDYVTPASTLTALNTYVQGGGRLGAEIWDVMNNTTAPLFTTMGVAYVNNYNDPTPATYWWNPSHAIFTTPDSAPAWPSYTCPAYYSCGQFVDPVAGVSAALAGYTAAPASGQGALILRNDGHTIYKAFLDAANTDTDADSDGIKDAVELWTNIATYFSYSDIPWLSETPLTGSVPSGNRQIVNVTFDASVVTQAGKYVGTLRILTNDLAHPEISVPVTMTVTTGPILKLYLPLIIR